MKKNPVRVIMLLMVALTTCIAQAFAQDETTALSILRQKAEQGDSWGQDLLGTLYYFGGLGLKQDYVEAAKWFRLSARQGYAEAEYFLGREYYGGQAGEQNYVEAAKWFRLAAEQGHAAAQFNLGVMYSNGQGVKQDSFAAVKWYQQAAAQGSAEAQFNLGVACTNGNGVEKNLKAAKEWYQKACDNGLQRGCSQYRILEQKGF
ncbi:MAG: sel1 repeat family protein [Chlorobiaceae bacterium]|nr:sel1 repeat family protein [Chlorobiaceae bacterium]